MHHSDNLAAGRTLNANGYTSGDSMTIESCINFCDQKGYIYAGTEYGVSAHPVLFLPFLSILFSLFDLDPRSRTRNEGQERTFCNFFLSRVPPHLGVAPYFLRFINN